MKKFFSALLTAALFALAASPIGATDVHVRTITNITQGQACKEIFELASTVRSWILRQPNTTSQYSVLVGTDWLLNNATATQKLALLRSEACRATGLFVNGLDMQILGGYYVSPIGKFVNSTMVIYPTQADGYSATNTITTATVAQTCRDMLDLASRDHQNDLIRYSFDGLVGYTAVVGDTWDKRLTNGQKASTLLMLECFATHGESVLPPKLGDPLRRLEIAIQNQNGTAIGRLLNGAMELYY